MRAVMLAAGVGHRLQLSEPLAKILLTFDGETLLKRHLRILAFCGVRHLDLVVGYRADEVLAEIDGADTDLRVTAHMNEDYTLGSIASLWAARSVLAGGDPVFFMDADVLYDHRLLVRLIESEHRNCFLLDRKVGPGDDPIKLCMTDGLLVDIHKHPKLPHEWRGEWIGFARFEPDIAAKIAKAAGRYMASGCHLAIYEDAFRDVLIAERPGTFGVEDVTGLPWVEIDFPEDLEVAKNEVLPQLEAIPA
ncbi:MAG: NTP transferase domain-containing protein [Candidatus Tectomicrobia bacterium]